MELFAKEGSELRQAQEFSRLAALGDAEFDMALLVSEVIDEGLDQHCVSVTLDRWKSQALAQQVNDVEQLLAFLRSLGFSRGKTLAADLSHNSIGWVISERQGLPIVIAVLLIKLARGLGLKAQGINFPGHFLLSIDDQVVDPLGLTIVEPMQLFGPEFSQDRLAALLLPATTKMIGQRMLNNVKAHFLQMQDWANAVKILQFQMAVTGDDASILAALHFEAAECWEFLEVNSQARVHYLQCAQLGAGDELSQVALQRLDEVDDAQDLVH